jgi:DNA-binding GntR family transcriptional regulator
MTMAAPEGQFALEGRPTAQLFADQLREQIVLGIFRPGEQINESAMASRLRTSRGPLREALQRLCQEGILVNHRNRGVFVLDLTTEDIKEIYAVREAVESAAADTLLDGSEEQITDTCDVLQGIIKDMAKQVAVSDWQAIAQQDMQFHTSFVAGTGKFPPQTDLRDTGRRIPNVYPQSGSLLSPCGRPRSGAPEHPGSAGSTRQKGTSKCHQTAHAKGR